MSWSSEFLFFFSCLMVSVHLFEYCLVQKLGFLLTNELNIIIIMIIIKNGIIWTSLFIAWDFFLHLFCLYYFLTMFNKIEITGKGYLPFLLFCPPRLFALTAHEKISYERVHIVLCLRDTVACKRAKHRSCSVFGFTKPRKSKLTNAISLCCCSVYGYLVSIIMLL